MSSMNARIVATINGTAHQFEAGGSILDAVRGLDVDVPHLCHDDRIEPVGACRLCLVQVRGKAQPVAACTTMLEDGMVVETHPPEIEALRRTTLSLIARRYPPAAAANDPHHSFHQLLTSYGVTPAGACRDEPYRDESHPYLAIDMDRCIHCYRCVRICEEVEGADVWQVWGRGPETSVRARGNRSLIDAGCVSCGACSDTCPTDAIRDRREKRAENWTRTTCVYCGVGCQMNVGTADDEIVAVRPARAAVNRAHLCVKGRYAFEFNGSAERVTTPMIRHNDRWEPVGWDDALNEVAARLQSIVDRDGPDAIGLLGSARGTNEESYYVQKFARVVLGTHNVDGCARVCHQPTAQAMKMIFGTGAATNGFDDIERAATILIAGCNPTEAHPVVGARIRQQARRGARLIVIDPRRTALAAEADVHLAVRPGTNVLLLGAIASVIIEESLIDESFIADRVDGLPAFAASLAPFAPEVVAERCGVAAADIRMAARLYATTGPAMCFHGLGITEHLQGTEGVLMLANLALLTGNVGKPGSGVNPLRGQNNVQGSAQMGCEPATLAGGQSLADARVRERFTATWGVDLPAAPGLNLMQMMDAARDDALRALWAVGYDIYLTLPHEAATARALRNVDLVVVQDLFMNRTAEAFGHVFLPAASAYEKDGTFMNSDRRVQRVRAVVPPAGDSRTDCWIIAEVARRMGFEHHFNHQSAEAIWDEIRSLWPASVGLSYDRLEIDPPPWPCPDASHPGTEVLHTERFAHGVRTALHPIEFVASPEQVDAEYPWLLTTGRNLYQFNAGTMTQRTANAALRPSDELEMAPSDADALGVRDGDQVAVRSRYGRVELPVRRLDRIRPGELFATFNQPALFVNRITSSVRDRMVDTPEYKVTAVQVIPVER